MSKYSLVFNLIRMDVCKFDSSRLSKMLQKGGQIAASNPSVLLTRMLVVMALQLPNWHKFISQHKLGYLLMPQLF